MLALISVAYRLFVLFCFPARFFYRSQLVLDHIPGPCNVFSRIMNTGRCKQVILVWQVTSYTLSDRSKLKEKKNYMYIYLYIIFLLHNNNYNFQPFWSSECYVHIGWYFYKTTTWECKRLPLCFRGKSDRGNESQWVSGKAKIKTPNP